MNDRAVSRPERLFSYDFIVLTLAAAFGFCNIAVFYGFSAYLGRLGVDPAWWGPLLAAEPLAAFCLRPFLSLLVTPQNALSIARWSLVGLGAALGGYPLVHGVALLAVVRLCHGVAFVCLVSAVTALLAQAIPKSLAGRAFGYFSLSALVPYAVMPPLAEGLLPLLGREDRVYACCAVFVLPALALLAPLERRLGRRAMAEVAGTSRPTLGQMRQTLAQPSVRLVLAANLCLFLSTTLIFFFIKPFASGLGLADPGLFFTVSTAASIAVRVLAGAAYDKLPRETLLVAALLALAGCIAGFADTSGQGRLLALAAGYGLCLGVAMPLANAIMFGLSKPAMRATNLNLMLFMMDTAYVFGPLAGGALLATGAGYPTLFLIAAGCALAAGLLMAPLAVVGWRALGKVR
ncbi:MFS transporter [Solidesulfovibrio magneticus]|uniref:Major facilitator superfamily protein n=1 Tax=Solidesulfovibrio magneticus (strain ATCC 700980 / DSM 13731 / RS-1) TaxID=573370 RepID=C4XR81_SOLM1|nr:MFS transporter [Solidesulfovibrio magneticus]BAH75426.1 major facilitator superfamily protein [Solidesulfovibrio magneticus RS-1]